MPDHYRPPLPSGHTLNEVLQLARNRMRADGVASSTTRRKSATLTITIGLYGWHWSFSYACTPYKVKKGPGRGSKRSIRERQGYIVYKEDTRLSKVLGRSVIGEREENEYMGASFSVWSATITLEIGAANTREAMSGYVSKVSEQLEAALESYPPPIYLKDIPDWTRCHLIARDILGAYAPALRLGPEAKDPRQGNLLTIWLGPGWEPLYRLTGYDRDPLDEHRGKNYSKSKMILAENTEDPSRGVATIPIYGKQKDVQKSWDKLTKRLFDKYAELCQSAKGGPALELPEPAPIVKRRFELGMFTPARPWEPNSLQAKDLMRALKRQVAHRRTLYLPWPQRAQESDQLEWRCPYLPEDAPRGGMLCVWATADHHPPRWKFFSFHKTPSKAHLNFDHRNYYGKWIKGDPDANLLVLDQSPGWEREYKAWDKPATIFVELPIIVDGTHPRTNARHLTGLLVEQVDRYNLENP